MKNKLIAIISAFVIGLCALLGGCSCSGDNTLSFNGNAASSEKFTYKVEYTDNYNQSTQKDGTLNGLFTFSYSNGTYTTELKQANKSDIPYNSDILNIKDAKDEPLVNTVYLLTSDFSIDINLAIGENNYTHTEKITTTAYIAQAGASYAPLYAKEEAEYTIIYANKTADAKILKSVSETLYDKAEYRNIKKNAYFDLDAAAETINLDNVAEKETKQKYSFRAVIDNTELLFALRGLTIEEKKSADISVKSPSYDAPQTLSVTNTVKSEEEFTLNYNGSEIKENIKYNSLSFGIKSSNKSGAAQYVNVQSEASASVAFNALVLKYVKPLITYGNFLRMGALVFTLTEVIVN